MPTDIGARLVRLEKLLRASVRAPKLANASVEGGSIEVYDDDGSLRVVVGQQPDGTSGVIAVNGPPPPQPSPPLVVARLGGVGATWDGTFAGGATLPMDFSRVEVHVSATGQFEPGPGTLVSTWESPRGGTCLIPTEAPVFVRLVARNTSGAGSVPSDVVGPVEPSKVVAQEVLDGIVTETKLAEGAVTAAKVAVAAINKDALAAGAVTAEKIGQQAVEAGKIAAGAVDLSTLGGALSDSAVQRYTDTMGDAAAWQVVQTRPGAAWTHRTGVADAPTGQTVGQANGHIRVRGNTLIPYEPGTLYRVSARIRATAEPTTGPDNVYVGVLGVGADKTTLVNRQGANSASGHYYVGASGRTIAAADGWVTIVGYLKDRAPAGGQGSAGPNPDARAPGMVHQDARFITPYLWLNFVSADVPGAPSVMQVDLVTVEALRTGVVDGTNLVSGAVTTSALAADAVTAGKIAAGAVSAREITVNTITAAQIAVGGITASSLSAGSVTAGAIAAGAVHAAHLVAGAVQAGSLAADSVSAGKIAADTVTGRELKALSVSTDKLAANSVTSGKIAAGAIETAHIAVGSVTPDQLSVGQGTNLIPDAGFEGAASANRLAAAGSAWSFAPGNRTGVGARVDATADAPAYFTLPLATAPILAASQLFLGVDVLTSQDLVAQAVKILARWEDSAGNILGFGVAETTEYVPGEWRRITGQVSAPQGTTRVVLCLEASAATGGWCVFDNTEAHTIFGDATGGARAEIGPRGMRLFDEDGDEVVSLLSGQPNALTFRDGADRVAAIGSTGDASFQNLNVAGSINVGGEDLTSLYNGPRGILAIDWMAGSAKTTAGTEMGFVELAFDAIQDRMYRVEFSAGVECSAAGGSAVVRLRSGYADSPLITSPQIQEARFPLTQTTRRQVDLRLVSGCGPTDYVRPGRNRLLITFTSDSGAPAGQQVTMSGASGRLGQFTVEDIGERVPETGAYNAGGAVVPVSPVRMTRTYKAAWSGSYANRAGFNAYHGNALAAGFFSSNNGVQAALTGFAGNIAGDLAGATILKAEVFLYANHWYFASGGATTIKPHSHASRPTRFSSQAASKTVTNWARASGKWVDITSIFNAATFRGIALDPNTTNKTWYGKFDGATSPRAPQLRVTYVK
ncbi:hypothetical protein [Streptomyces sp. NPDC058657]|uniref:hypothetical protein n=1 Tax=unclassified Streptomyces TaxID=2593676 RepID=UPI00364A450E